MESEDLIEIFKKLNKPCLIEQEGIVGISPINGIGIGEDGSMSIIAFMVNPDQTVRTATKKHKSFLQFIFGIDVYLFERQSPDPKYHSAISGFYYDGSWKSFFIFYGDDMELSEPDWDIRVPILSDNQVNIIKTLQS